MRVGNLHLKVVILILIMVYISVIKNSYVENQNIFISGISNNQIETIKWEFRQIS